MTTFAAALLVAAALAALADWMAVGAGWRRIGLATKPLVMLALVAMALALSPASDGQRTFFVAGLALALVGDVALLGPPRWFAAGLGAFLLAHLAYIAGLLQVPGNGDSVAAGVIFVILADAFVGIPIVRGAAARRGAALGVAVAAYLVVISVTVVVAGASDLTLARIGAVGLYASDGILGWNRFVQPLQRGRLLTRIPYHLGQGLLVLSLAFTG